MIGVSLGYYYTRDLNVAHDQTVSRSDKQPNPTVFKPTTTVTRGAKHENLSKRHGVKAARARSHSRASRPLDEGKKLPSIYSSQKAQRPEPAVTAEGEEESEDSQSLVQDTVVHGVPVQAWAQSKQNHLNTEVPDPNAGSGMRFFVGCLEMKKKGARFEQKDCQAMIAQSTDTISKYNKIR